MNSPAPRPPRHLLFSDAPDLAARLAALPIFKAASPNSVEQELLTRFLRPDPPVEACASLSEELDMRFQRAEQYVQTLPATAQSRLASALVALRGSVRRDLCDECAQASRHICRGHNEVLDDLQLDNPGLCLQILHQMYADVISRYGETLRQWAYVDNARAQADLTCFMSTRVKAASLYDAPGPEWKSGGTTRFCDGATGRLSEIGLSLNVEELDWPSLCACYWVFLHEYVYVCHAQQGRPTGEVRAACRVSCPFFEGWMDELAFLLLQADLIARHLPTAPGEFVARYAAAVHQAASDFRRDRYGWGPSQRRMKYSAQWDLGANAAWEVLAFFARHDPGSGPNVRLESVKLLLELSYRLQFSANSFAK